MRVGLWRQIGGISVEAWPFEACCWTGAAPSSTFTGSVLKGSGLARLKAAGDFDPAYFPAHASAVPMRAVVSRRGGVPVNR